MKLSLLLMGLGLLMTSLAAAAQDWDRWPPRKYLIRSLVEDVPGLMKAYHPETGRFGSEPWICGDQNRIFALAAAWAIEDPDNPYYHDEKVLEVIAGGGEALVDAQDEAGKWPFDKKDGSNWGPIHMPWTYSRWIRAYVLVRDALPEASRKKWEEGLLLGFKGIRRYADGGVHNIPTHHAMALYIAGTAFENEEWQQAAKAFMAKAVAKQDPGGYWSEHFGPVIGYNAVYVDALGVYYHFSRDPVALEAMARSAKFHSDVLLPDGSSIACIDERQIYHGGVSIGNVGFSWTPEGRGFLLQQVGKHSADGTGNAVGADYAAAMLLYGGEGEAIMPASGGDDSATFLGDRDALIRRFKPWAWAFSGYACAPTTSRWIQDRHNLVDVYHDDLGLAIGGGNTKLQPYWSTFTVGDPSLLTHTPGDESPNFTPEIELQWTPDEATITTEGNASTLALKYGEAECSVTARPQADGSLELIYRAPAGKGAEGHIPLLKRRAKLYFASGEHVRLAEEELLLGSEQTGGHIVFGDLKLTVPDGATLRWPARQHNPYTKDGRSSLSAAKLVLALPFDEVGEYVVSLSHQPIQPFDGLAFEAREVPVTHSEGTYTKRLDGLGSQFMGTTKVGDRLSFTLPEVEPGRYELFAEFVMADVYAIVKVVLDGEQVGELFDAYWEGVDADGERVSFGEVELGAGEHQVAVEIVGKNEKAKNTMISVKRWLLRPVQGG